MQLALKPLQRSHSFDLSTTPGTPHSTNHDHFGFKVEEPNFAKMASHMLPVRSLPLEARTSSQNNLVGKCSKPKSRYTVRPFLQGSLEGLNQELESLSVEASTYSTHKPDTIPDGHRAPVNELLYLFRDSPNNNNLFIDSIHNANNNDIHNKSCNIISKESFKNSLTKSHARLKINITKRCCDVKSSACAVGDGVVTHASNTNENELGYVNLDVEPTTRAEFKNELAERPSVSPSLPSPQPPSLSFPLPPTDHLPFNYPTPLQPSNQSTLERSLGAQEARGASTNCDNVANTEATNNDNSDKISRKQLLIPSNQSAFTSVSKGTHPHANYTAIATTSLN